MNTEDLKKAQEGAAQKECGQTDAAACSEAERQARIKAKINDMSLEDRELYYQLCNGGW